MNGIYFKCRCRGFVLGEVRVGLLGTRYLLNSVRSITNTVKRLYYNKYVLTLLSIKYFFITNKNVHMVTQTYNVYQIKPL